MPQYVVVVNAEHLNIAQKENVAKNVIRIISVLNVYYGTNAYCVRIKGVLVFNKGCPYMYVNNFF